LIQIVSKTLQYKPTQQVPIPSYHRFITKPCHSRPQHEPLFRSTWFLYRTFYKILSRRRSNEIIDAGISTAPALVSRSNLVCPSALPSIQVRRTILWVIFHYQKSLSRLVPLRVKANQQGKCISSIHSSRPTLAIPRSRLGAQGLKGTQ
jgi:hypothetical protein